MSQTVKEESASPRRGRLLRGLFMVLFVFAYNVAEFVLIAIAVLQFLIVLVTGERDEQLLRFGRSLSAYAYRIFLFLTYNTETKPWPFSDWPTSPETES